MYLNHSACLLTVRDLCSSALWPVWWTGLVISNWRSDGLNLSDFFILKPGSQEADICDFLDL